MNPKLLPSFLICVYTVSAIVYGVHGDWRHALYWSAAALITVSVTY